MSVCPCDWRQFSSTIRAKLKPGTAAADVKTLRALNTMSLLELISTDYSYTPHILSQIVL